MSLKLIAAVVLSAIAIRCDAALALPKRFAPVQTTRKVAVLKLSDLRSAYLVRAGVVRYDPATYSPESIREQLQRHFNVVLGLLFVSTPQSIDSALDRLEMSSNQQWTKSDREFWRQRLLSLRYLQLARLAAYCDRGQFPLNEGQSTYAVPIFVDMHDTACAVGQLMRWSGWLREVDGVQKSNNLVYVPDAATGPVAKWVLTSGLTIEEAALIQPSYGFMPRTPAIPADAMNTLASNWSSVVDDLRFSNFKLIQSVDPRTLAVNIPIQHVTGCSMFCAFPLLPVHPGVPLGPILPDGNLELNRSVTSLPVESVLIQFDVETISPAVLLSASPYATSLMTYYGNTATYGRNEVGLFASDDTKELLFDHRTLEFNYSNIGPHSAPDDSPPFQLTRKMTVITDLWLTDGRPTEAQLLHFDVITVPEPGAAVLCMFCCALMVATRRRTIGCR